MVKRMLARTMHVGDDVEDDAPDSTPAAPKEHDRGPPSVALTRVRAEKKGDDFFINLVELAEADALWAHAAQARRKTGGRK